MAFPYLSAGARLIGALGAATTEMRRWMTAVEAVVASATDLSVFQSYLRTSPVPIADLPPASDVLTGTRAFVTDASNSTFSDVVVAGGSFIIPVYSDGSNWRLG